MKLTLLSEPAFPAGPTRVRVGSTDYAVPHGAGVAESESGPGLVYLLHAATLHALTEAGEVRVPDSLRSRIASRYFGNGRKP